MRLVVTPALEGGLQDCRLPQHEYRCDTDPAIQDYINQLNVELAPI
jgi:hypothetical protein